MNFLMGLLITYGFMIAVGVIWEWRERRKMRAEEKGVIVRSEMMKYIREYFKKHGYAPSYREIAKGVSISVTYVFSNMKILFNDGKLETDLKDNFHTPRAYRLARGKK